MTLPDPTGAPDAVRFSALRSSAEISVGAANPHRGSSRAKGLRRQACAYSGEVVTKFQSDSSRTDLPVRILYAQPRSRLKPEVRKRKTPSRGLRSASHSWPYACAGGPRPPVPPVLGGRSFTIGPFYAKPELLIGFAAAVACTIALRFMLQATYLTFCRPSL